MSQVPDLVQQWKFRDLWFADSAAFIAIFPSTLAHMLMGPIIVHEALSRRDPCWMLWPLAMGATSGVMVAVTILVAATGALLTAPMRTIVLALRIGLITGVFVSGVVESCAIGYWATLFHKRRLHQR